MSQPSEIAAPEAREEEESSRSLLIVHEDEAILRRLTMLFNGVYTVAFVETLSLAVNLVRQGYRPQVVLLPGNGGEGDQPFLAGLQESLPETVLILVFKELIPAKAVKPGASPAAAPFMKLNLSRQVPELIQTVRLGFQQYRLRVQNRKLRDLLARQDVVRAKIGEEEREMERMCRQGLSTSQEHLQLAAALGKAVGTVRATSTQGGAALLGGDGGSPVNPSLFAALACHETALALGLEERRVKRLLLAALLRDVGTLVLPPEAADGDPEALAGEARALYESHVLEGVVLLEEMGLPRTVVEIVAQHHEHPDGTGFPNRTVESEIGTEARLLALADACHHRLHIAGKRARRKDDAEEIGAWLQEREGAAAADLVRALAAAVTAIERDETVCRTFGERLAGIDWSPLLGDPLANDPHAAQGGEWADERPPEDDPAPVSAVENLPSISLHAGPSLL